MTSMRRPMRCPMRRSRTVLLATAALLAVVPNAAQAQGARIGGIVGATFSKLSGIDNLDQRNGTMGGVSLVLPLAGPFSLQPEALVVSKGAQGQLSSSAGGVKLTYAEVPVLLRLQLSPSSLLAPHVYAGPYFGYQVDCSVEGSDVDCDDLPGVSTKSVDVGGIAGGGLDLDLGGLVLTGGLRYEFGVSKVIDFDTSNVRESAKNGTFAIYAGLSFRLGGKR